MHFDLDMKLIPNGSRRKKEQGGINVFTNLSESCSGDHECIEIKGTYRYKCGDEGDYVILKENGEVEIEKYEVFHSNYEVESSVDSDSSIPMQNLQQLLGFIVEEGN